MSTTIEISSPFWSKTLADEDSSPSHLDDLDQETLRNYYRLESESSRASDDDTESIYSLQGKETDIVKDSSDTETNLDVSEYEIEGFSDNECWEEDSIISSGSNDLTLSHLVAAAQALYDSPMEKWITDCEESDNSSLDDLTLTINGFSKCTKCHSKNVNPHYRYCEQCYQDRKKYFPPRPRRKNKSKKKFVPTVKLEHLKSALSVLSQDSGIGSSQEITLPPSDNIDSTKEYSGTSVIPSSTTTSSLTSKEPSKGSANKLSKSTSNTDGFSPRKKRKRGLSESSVSDLEIKRSKIDLKVSPRTSDLGSTITNEDETNPTRKYNRRKSAVESVGKSTVTTSQAVKLVGKATVTTSQAVESVDKSTVTTSQNVKESSDMCIICNDAPKDSIFLHTNIAHQCCCYKCAKLTLHTIKRCPICNRSVNKVVKIFTS